MVASDERRRHDRVSLTHKLAICFSPAQESLYNVCDLSVEGARLRRGPRLDVGTPIRLEILDGPLTPVRLAGLVVHVGERGIGVAFATEEGHRPGRMLRMLERARRASQIELY